MCRFFIVMVNIDIYEDFNEFCLFIGNKDPIIEINWARLSEQCFKNMGFENYIFQEYDQMVHTNTEQVIIQ